MSELFLVKLGDMYVVGTGSTIKEQEELRKEVKKYGISE